MSKQFQLYFWKEPQQYRAGTSGDKPFYHDCGGCGAKEPVIHSHIASGPAWENMGIVPDGPFFKLAVFCGSCTELLKQGKPTPNQAKESAA